MVLQKVILLAIFACVTVYAAVPITSRRHLTRDEFLGQWFVMATITKDGIGVEIKCFTMNVTKNGDDPEGIVEDILSYSVLGDYDYDNTAKLYGKVTDSHLHLNSADGKSPTTLRTYKFDNGQQQVLHDPSKPFDFMLISRTPTMPTEIMEKFRNFAALFNGYVTTFVADDCEEEE